MQLEYIQVLIIILSWQGNVEVINTSDSVLQAYMHLYNKY